MKNSQQKISLYVGVLKSKKPVAQPMPFPKSGLVTCHFCGISAHNDVSYVTDLFYRYQISRKGLPLTVHSCAFCTQSTHLDTHGRGNGEIFLLNQLSPLRIMNMSIYYLMAQAMDDEKEAYAQAQYIASEEAPDSEGKSSTPEFDPKQRNIHLQPAYIAASQIGTLRTISDTNYENTFPNAGLNGEHAVETMITLLSEAKGPEYGLMVAKFNKMFRYAPSISGKNRRIATYFAKNGVLKQYPISKWLKTSKEKAQEIRDAQ